MIEKENTFLGLRQQSPLPGEEGEMGGCVMLAGFYTANFSISLSQYHYFTGEDEFKRQSQAV